MAEPVTRRDMEELGKTMTDGMAKLHASMTALVTQFTEFSCKLKAVEVEVAELRDNGKATDTQVKKLEKQLQELKPHSSNTVYEEVTARLQNMTKRVVCFGNGKDDDTQVAIIASLGAGVLHKLGGKDQQQQTRYLVEFPDATTIKQNLTPNKYKELAQEHIYLDLSLTRQQQQPPSAQGR